MTAEVAGFAARLEVLQYDQKAAAHTGLLRAELSRAGMTNALDTPLY